MRLYHEGQRVGYLPPGGGGGGEKVLQGSEEASPLPPARLHLGSERLALTTVVSKSSFAIQVMSQIEKKKIIQVSNHIIFFRIIQDAPYVSLALLASYILSESKGIGKPCLPFLI